ncbi:MAG TPA: hypothetical protein VIF15_09480 [Polyangiaceae bacterium]
MRRLSAAFSAPAAVASALLAGGAAGGCSSNSGDGSDASIDSFGVITGSDAAGDDAESGAETSVGTTMRLAHMSPDLGPIDFCWRVAGSASFTGPVLGATSDAGPDEAGLDASDADAGDGGDAAATPDAAPDGSVDAGASDVATDTADGGDGASLDAGPPLALTFGAMTRDVALTTSGTFDIALVAAGGTTCNGKLLVGQVTLDVGKRSTVVVMGLAGADAGAEAALSLVGFTDEPVDPQMARVRFIHAALGWPGGRAAPPLGVRAGSQVLVVEVDPKHASAQSMTPTIDALGYTTLTGLTAPAPLRLDALGDAAPQSWATDSANLALLPGTAHTGFIVSRDVGAIGVAWCGDSSSTARPTCGMLPAH